MGGEPSLSTFINFIFSVSAPPTTLLMYVDNFDYNNSVNDPSDLPHSARKTEDKGPSSVNTKKT